MKTNNGEDLLFRKCKDGSFTPVGYFYDRDWLGNGIWYVRTSSTTNGEYMGEMFKIDDCPQPTFKQVCEMQDYVDHIFNHRSFKDMIDRKEGYSLNELICKMVAVMYEKIEDDNKKLKNEEK